MIDSKLLRDKFIKFLEKKCNNSTISNKSLGMLIRTFHISSPIITLIIISSTSQILSSINLIFLLIVVMMYVLFNGCILTLLETKLCKDTYTIVDPFIELYGMKVNYKNRKYFTACIMIPYVIIILLIYYFRFIR